MKTLWKRLQALNLGITADSRDFGLTIEFRPFKWQFYFGTVPMGAIFGLDIGIGPLSISVCKI